MQSSPPSVDKNLLTQDNGERDSFIAVLTEFSTYGFRKTSMASLAKASGVARQTLYNRFKNKEAVLKWAVKGLGQCLYTEAISCLRDNYEGDKFILVEVFWRWLGPIVTILSNYPNAEEILGMSKAALNQSNLDAALNRQPNIDPLAEITEEISSFLHSRNFRDSSAAADSAAYMLVMAAKGLLYASNNEAEFKQGIHQVIEGANFPTSSETT